MNQSRLQRVSVFHLNRDVVWASKNLRTRSRNQVTIVVTAVFAVAVLLATQHSIAATKHTPATEEGDSSSAQVASTMIDRSNPTEPVYLEDLFAQHNVDSVSLRPNVRQVEWRYTSEGWVPLSEMTVYQAEPSEWSFGQLNPLLFASLLVLAICAIAVVASSRFDSKRNDRILGSADSDDIEPQEDD